MGKRERRKTYKEGRKAKRGQGREGRGNYLLQGDAPENINMNGRVASSAHKMANNVPTTAVLRHSSNPV